MKGRKQYESDQERKADQHIGFIACIVVNLILYIVLSLLRGVGTPGIQTILSLLPWVANIGFLVLTLLFWPEIAVGYLVVLSIVLVGGVVLGILFVAACLVGLAVGIVFSPLGRIADFVLWIVFGISFLVGLFFMGYIFYQQIMKWWSGH